MLDALSQILDFFKMIITLLINMITSLFKVIVMFPQWIGSLSVWILGLPSIVTAFILFGVTLSVVFFLIDRPSA